MKFHEYLKQLRKKRFQDTKKMVMMLGVTKDMWRKIERGINPPPKKSILRKFCLLTGTLSYEENQLYALARRWKPHEDTNTGNHQLFQNWRLINKNSDPKWTEALLAQNKPDYEHRHWGKH